MADLAMHFGSLCLYHCQYEHYLFLCHLVILKTLFDLVQSAYVTIGLNFILLILPDVYFQLFDVFLYTL